LASREKSGVLAILISKKRLLGLSKKSTREEVEHAARQEWEKGQASAASKNCVDHSKLKEKE